MVQLTNIEAYNCLECEYKFYTEIVLNAPDYSEYYLCCSRRWSWMCNVLCGHLCTMYKVVITVQCIMWSWPVRGLMCKPVKVRRLARYGALRYFCTGFVIECVGHCGPSTFTILCCISYQTGQEFTIQRKINDVLMS